MVPLTVNFTAASAPGLGLAVGARGATEGLAVDGPQGADTAPGAANGDPGLTLLEKARGESGSEEGRASSPFSRLVSRSPRSEWICWPRLEAATGHLQPAVPVHLLEASRLVSYIHCCSGKYPTYR